MKQISHIFALILFWAFMPPAAGAQSPLSLEARVGFDGYYKTDAWTPIQVTVANQGPGLQAVLRVRDQSAGFDLSDVVHVYPVELPGQSRKQVVLYTPLRGQSQVEVELATGAGQLLLSKKAGLAPLDRQALLIGVVASDGSLLNRLAGLKTVAGKPVAVAHLKLNDLPANPLAWDSLDILVFNDVDTALLAAGQQEALDNWVGSGGRLIVGGGPNAGQTIAGLKPLLPLAGVSSQTLPHPLSGLQNFVRAALDDRGPYVAAVPLQPAGRVMVRQDDQPLIVGSGYGLGQVYYLALDLGLAPLDSLASQPQFLSQLTGPLQPRPWTRENFNRYQMRDSLALIPGQTLPSPGKVALYLLIYTLVTGPVNYLVLRRLRRREWTWLTLPAIILIFSGYSYFSGFRLRGGQPLLRQITVVQADLAPSLGRVDSFVGVYSPRRTAYNLDIGSPVLVESFGSFGLNSELTVTTGDSTRVENLRSDVGGMPTFVAHSYAAAPQITANLSYNEANHCLSGTLSNNTGRPLSDALLVMNNELLRLGELPAGQQKIGGITTYYYVNAMSEVQKQSDPAEAIKLASHNSAVQALFNLGNNTGAGLRGLYLVGWQDGSSIPVALTNSPGDRMSETVLVVGLPFIQFFSQPSPGQEQQCLPSSN